MTLEVSYKVIVNSARVAYGSITSLSTVLSVLTANHDGRLLAIANTLDTDMWLTLDGSNWVPLPAQQGGGLDLARIYIPVNSVIGVLPMSATPTSGWLGLSLI